MIVPEEKPSPRKMRIDVREQEKESIVDCHMISSSDGFTSLSACNKEMFDYCQDEKRECFAELPAVAKECSGSRLDARIAMLIMPPPTAVSSRRSISAFSHSKHSSGGKSKCSSGTKEIRGFEPMAGGITIKDVRRPQSSRGYRSIPSSLSHSFCPSFRHDQQRASAGSGWSPVPQGMNSASLSPVSLSSRLSGMTTEASMMAREAAVAAREAAVAER